MAAPQETIECHNDPSWQHCTSIEGNKRKVKCNWCGKEMHGGVARFKQHLAGLKGQVKPCESCPRELRDEMRALISGKKVIRDFRREKEAELREEISGRSAGPRIPVRAPGVSIRGSDIPGGTGGVTNVSDDEEDEDIRIARQESIRQMHVEEERRRSGASGTGSGSGTAATSRRIPPHASAGSGLSSAGTLDAFAFRPHSSKQPIIKQALKGMKKGAEATAHAFKSITKFFLHSGIPAHVASSPYFQSMLDAVGEYGPGLRAPTPKDIYGAGLNAEVAELQAWVDNFKLIWKAKGCTLMCDGWTGTTRKSMINFLVYCTEGTVFLKSVDASNYTKSATYLCGLMDEVITQIGEENVVQVVTDNEANYKAAGKKLMEKRKHLYWVPCAAHCLDLMLEDVGKEK